MKVFESAKPFQSIPDACEFTGLSQSFLRAGCRDGSIPHIRSGKKYFINVPALLRQLGVPLEGVETHG